MKSESLGHLLICKTLRKNGLMNDDALKASPSINSSAEAANYRGQEKLAVFDSAFTACHIER